MSAPVTFTLSLQALTSDALNAAMIAHLEEQGYGITAPHEAWETPRAFLRRIGLRSHETLQRSIELWNRRGHHLQCSRGPTGRIKELLSNPAFDAFCRRNKR